MDIAFLDKIREQEVAVAGAQLSQPPGRLLEIGAGTGAQAKVLSQRGFDVHAIDIAGSIYEADKVFPVAIYDGTTIPFADASFDIVFSSHVLMHIAAADLFQQEILRVLKPGGQVVHILPTTSWRFWTCLVHYPARYLSHAARAFKALVGGCGVATSKAASVVTPSAQQATPVWARVWSAAVFPFTPPARIGERGNAWSEHYLFSERCWNDLFQRNGQVVKACVPNRLFYTGHMSFGSRLQMQVRAALSYVLGSAGKVYVLRVQKQL
jgi:ubiquinone/menaquinone biosynthesis C-methylase UbiE